MKEGKSSRESGSNMMSACGKRPLAIGSGRHALVIGGSIAGLLAARVLTNHFDRVTIVERDRVRDTPEPRKGVPQSCHIHVLLVRGLQILEQLFPGIEAELAASGAAPIDLIRDCGSLGFGSWAPRFPSNLKTRACSRNLLEWTIRRRLVASGNVCFMQSQVTELLADTGKTRVKGVRVQFRDRTWPDSTPTEAELLANLVVDASGRNSRTPQWLAALGYASPQETAVNSFLGYSSRWYQRPTGLQKDWKTLIVGTKPPEISRAGIVYPQEGDRWIVTLSGVGRDYPPTDEAGFLNFARSLRSPMLYEAIKDAQPLSPVYSYRGTGNRLRHYERLSRWPEGLIVVGDAVCAFNPVYGQGMTVAALEALALDRCLSEQDRHHHNRDLKGLARRFQKQLFKVIATPWLMATGEDFRWPTTEGGKPGLMTRLIHQYMGRVLLLSNASADIHKVFWEVLHMIQPPTALFQPNIMARVVAATFKGWLKDKSCSQEQDIAKVPSKAVDSLT